MDSSQFGKLHLLRTPQSTYIENLFESVDLVLEEDQSLLNDYEDHFAERKVYLESLTDDKVGTTILIELLMQEAFVKLKFGEELEAAWSFRKSYRLLDQGKKKYPGDPIFLKSLGLFNIIIGSIPDKYQWLLSLFGMEGDLTLGINQLDEYYKINSAFSAEIPLIKKLINKYLANGSMANDSIKLPNNNYLTSLVNLMTGLKSGKNEAAINSLSSLTNQREPHPIVHYFAGEAYLRKAEYSLARMHLLKFIYMYKGETNLKDAHYKIGLSYHLEGMKDSVHLYFVKARKIGAERSEADKHAVRVLDKEYLPNKLLLKIRLFTDGGYYRQARDLIENHKKVDFTLREEALEFIYRQARLEHKSNNLDAAIPRYEETIQLSPTQGFYFAPNACLQLGYIYRGMKDYEKAKEYFKKVKLYSRHEYKNSLDQKAKTALTNLK